MDLTILTTFFCLILLVLMVLALNELMILKRKVNAHLDRSDLHSDKLATILSILQQIEAKQDLIFNNAPPAPGETSKEDAPEDHSWHYPRITSSGQFTYSEPVFPTQWGKISETDLDIAEDRFGQSCEKVSITVPTEITPLQELRKSAEEHGWLPPEQYISEKAIPPVNVPFAESRYGQGVPRPAKKRGRPKKAPLELKDR
jgi:hypothetical protein